ncbi:hypothetical protein DERP_006981 [Dermatophagoides pteronyssinus]|uniref:Uncharacterized protein n=1 Tax=Dermatophagoides pteronyssinus TaxID=6956 RepID=A0ABQ8JUQ4_DERPT|nr:hypothetical protein DERP_006981 [Dermatophagoides pteronyssinus]
MIGIFISPKPPCFRGVLHHARCEKCESTDTATTSKNSTKYLPWKSANLTSLNCLSTTAVALKSGAGRCTNADMKRVFINGLTLRMAHGIDARVINFPSKDAIFLF